MREEKRISHIESESGEYGLKAQISKLHHSALD